MIFERPILPDFLPTRQAILVACVLFCACMTLQGQSSLRWQQTPGPHSSAAAAVAFMNADTLFMGRSNGALWRSYDGGQSWKSLPTFSDYIVTLAAYPGGRVLAGQRNGTIHVSDDYGTSWRLALDKSGEIDLRQFLRGSERVIFAASSNNGVLRSRNGGEDWDEIYEAEAVCLALTGNGTLYMGTSEGVYASGDQGDNWRFIGLHGSKVNAMLTTDDGAIFAATDHGIYTGQGGGVDVIPQWRSIGPGVRTIDNLVMAADGVLLAAPAEGGLVRSCGAGCWRESGLDDVNVNDLVLDADGTVFAATTVGLYASQDNGQNWAAVMPTVANSLVPQLVATESGRIVAASHSAGIMYSDDPRSLWTAVPDMRETFISALHYTTDGAVLAGSWGKGIFRSEDDGVTWTSHDDQIHHTVALEFTNGDDGNIYAASDNGVLFSNDSGRTWGLTEPLPVFKPAQSIAFSNESGWIYVATDVGVFRSYGLGRVWIPISNGLANLEVTHVRRDPRDGAMICATADGHVYRYNLAAAEWFRLSATPPAARTYDLLADSDFGILNAGPAGVQQFDEKTAGWKDINDGLNSNPVRVLAKDQFGRLFAGTNESGVFFLENQSVVSVGDKSTLHKVSISPHPVGRRLHMQLEVPQAGALNVRLYDVRGQIVAEFIKTTADLGQVQCEFDVSELAAGQYFYHLGGPGGLAHSGSFIKR